MWQLIARFLARSAVADWIIRRAMRTPYDHLVIAQTGRIHRVPDCPITFIPGGPRAYWYMRRYWFARLGPLQMRVHHICAEDPGRDVHDHPWPFRTFILRGSYVEQRGGVHYRGAGDTMVMGRGEFHRIAQVADGGAWTLFVTFGPRRGWGFKVGDAVVPHEEY
jgi:hypothetical protein